MKTEEAFFSKAGKAELVTGIPLGDMLIVVRNFKGGPQGCPCDNCPKEVAPANLVMLNEWADLRMGDPWPTFKTVMANDKALDTAAGEAPEQHVALWYVHGEPVMGRVWCKDGKVVFSHPHNNTTSNDVRWRLHLDGVATHSRIASVQFKCW